jgi:predicted Zn-dependent peptidase
VNKEEIIFNALDAMKEQDALLDRKQSTSKIIMSIETYERMQKDPEIAKDICGRIYSVENISLKDADEFLKKWQLLNNNI